MPKTEIYPKKIAPIIYVIDTSGSMSGDRIAALNEGMSIAVKMLKKEAEDIPDFQIVVGVLTFSSGATWITGELVNIEEFQWIDLTAGGPTDFGAAINELNDKICRKKYMNRVDRYVTPTIICISDGYATDLWEEAIESATKNAWIKTARKYCIAIGEADKEMLLKFIKVKEAIIAANENDIEEKLILLHDLMIKDGIGIRIREDAIYPDSFSDIISDIIREDTIDDFSYCSDEDWW